MGQWPVDRKWSSAITFAEIVYFIGCERHPHPQ
jgi:hypothetical protein